MPVVKNLEEARRLPVHVEEEEKRGEGKIPEIISHKNKYRLIRLSLVVWRQQDSPSLRLA